MNRILGIFAASSVLLTACGGGLQSPSFTPVLAGFFVGSQAENPATPGALFVVPGGTLQLVARGLYSTPPGTSPTASGVVPCNDPATVASEVCTLGAVSGVTFSIDSQANSSQPLASVNSGGLVSGLRRGQATVRARLPGFTDTFRSLIVNGTVLSSIAVTALDVKNNQLLTARPASVPTGRVIALTGVATCSSGYQGGTGDNALNNNATCLNQNYNFSWNLPAATSADTVTFIPSSALGETIAVRTKRFGPFGIEVRLTNEEGDVKEGSINLEATSRVLDDVIVVADPVEAEPVAIVKGTRVRFVAKGVFSDGTTDDLIEADLGADRPSNAGTSYREGRRLTWRQDSSFVGGPIIIEDPADADGDGVIDAGETGNFNNSVIVSVMETADSPATIGANGLTAAGFNIEQIPVSGSSTGAADPLQVEDRAAIRIDDLGLTAITRICLASDIGSACTTNTQVQQNGDPMKYVARGTFEGDAVGTERNIDPRVIPIRFSASTTTANLIAVNVDGDQDGKDGDPATLDPDTTIDFDDVGTVQGKVQGLARLIASLPNGFATTIADRDEMIDIAVTEQGCQDQFLTGNGTLSSSDNGDLIGISDVRDDGNVIDGLANTYGTFTVGPSVSGGTLSMDFRRDGTPLLAAGGTLNVGFTLNDQDGFVTSSTVTIETLNSTGGTVQTFNSITPSSNGAAGDAQRTLIQAQATQPFSGVRMLVDVSLLLGIPGSLVDLSLLTGHEVRVFSACGRVVQPVTP